MDIRRLLCIALLAALMAVATLVLRIPMPATEGDINVGDAVIVAGALLLGGWSAGLAGGRFGIGRWARGICSLGAFYLNLL